MANMMKFNLGDIKLGQIWKSFIMFDVNIMKASEEKGVIGIIGILQHFKAYELYGTVICCAVSNT